jgi:LytS/YehU family sensor histidine kinase
VPRKGTGTGLSNVKKRMSAIYGRSDLLTFNATNEVFEVKLQIPVQNEPT